METTKEHLLPSWLEAVKARLQPGMDAALQTELAQALGLLAALEQEKEEQLSALGEIMLAALLTDPPNLELAAGLRQQLMQALAKRQQRHIWKNIFRPESPAVMVILGLDTLLYAFMPLLSLLFAWLFDAGDQVFGISVTLLFGILLAGGLGSVVSILVRIQDFARIAQPDPSVLFFTGFFKPVIGMAFALFVFAVIQAGLIPVQADPVTDAYFFLALAFVAGFSERFARDIADKTEASLLT